MSAPILNAAFPGQTPGQTPGAPGATTPASGSAAAGFQALLGALFGGQDGLGAQLFAGAGPAKDAAGKTVATDETKDAGETADAGAEAQMLAGLMGLPVAPTVQAQITTTAAPEAGQGAATSTAPVVDPGAVADALIADAIAKGGKPAAEDKPATDATGVPAPAASKASAQAQARAQGAAHARTPAHAAPEAAVPLAPAPAADAATQVAAMEGAPLPVERPAPAATERNAKTVGAPAAHAAASTAVEDANAVLTTRAPAAAAPTGGEQSATGGQTSSGSGDLAAVDVALKETKPAATEPQPLQTSTPITAPAATAAPAHAALPARVTSETLAHLAAQIARNGEGGRSTQFDIELNPIGLGRVDVRLEISAHGQITAAMSFDNAASAAEVRGRAAELHRALEQAGFDISQGGLSFDVAGDRGQPGQGFNGRDGASDVFRGRAFQAALNIDATADAAAASGLNLQRRTNSGVDIRI